MWGIFYLEENTSTRSIPAKSISERTNFHPAVVNIVRTSRPAPSPISRYILPPRVIHLRAFFAIAIYAANPLSSAYSAIFGSCDAPISTRVSPRAIYGGFDTIMSNRGWRIMFCFVKSPIFTETLSVTFKSRTFFRATRAAPHDFSIAKTCAFGMFFANATAMHPVPVPRSRICTPLL